MNKAAVRFDVRWRGITAGIAAIGLLAGLGQARQAFGQIPGANKPDVQIILMPLPTGQWGVSSVYPKQISKKEADARQARLLAASHWNAEGVAFEDGRMNREIKPEEFSKENRPGTPPPPIMSSLSFMTSGKAVDFQNGTMVLEPFALAFRDLNRVHITYVMPKGFVFQGLRHYDGPDVAVDMMSGGEGAYTYVVNIRNHQLNALTLPKTDPLSPGAQGGAVRKPNKLVGGGVVVLIALIAGGLVYLWAQKLGSGARSA